MPEGAVTGAGTGICVRVHRCAAASEFRVVVRPEGLRVTIRIRVIVCSYSSCLQRGLKGLDLGFGLGLGFMVAVRPDRLRVRFRGRGRVGVGLGFMIAEGPDMLRVRVRVHDCGKA